MIDINDNTFEKLQSAKNDGEVEHILREIVLESNDEELSENDLAMVAGGNRTFDSAKIVFVTYYEIKKYGRPRTYSDGDIIEAMNWVDRQTGLFNAAVKDTIKTMIEISPYIKMLL